MSTKYFLDDNYDTILLRKRDGLFELEFINKNYLQWRHIIGESSYEREYYIGQGNNCLTRITEVKAFEILKSWGYKE